MNDISSDNFIQKADAVFRPEHTPARVHLELGCGDTLHFDAGSVTLQSPGAILDLCVTVKSVCPGKRVALAVILTELVVEHLRFVLPQELDVSGGLAEGRAFHVRLLANCVDFEGTFPDSVLMDANENTPFGPTHVCSLAP